MAAKPKTPDTGAQETTPTTHYRVLSSGISTPTGARYRGAVVATDDLGDADRVASLLAKGAIEEVLHNDD